MPGRRGVVASVIVLVVLAGCAGGVGGGEAPAVESGGDTGSAGTPPSETATDSKTLSVNGSLEVHFINVGQSVSTLVVTPAGETLLIDTGHFRDDGEHVLAYLQRNDVERIDHLVVSHNDADHIGGNAAIIEYYETEADGIGEVNDPGIGASTQTYSAYLDAVEEYDIDLVETREGDPLPVDGIETQVMGPPEPYLENEARNENSIVLKLTYGRTSFLFTGDAEDNQEAYLVEEYGSQLRATVLKAGHHGSSSSTSGALLDTAQPKAVVISSAYDSQYGHPNEETLGRLAERSIPTYWTATHGHVVLVSNGEGVTVRTQAQAPTDASMLRDASAVGVDSTAPLADRARIGSGGAVIQREGTPTATPVPDGGTPQLALAEVNADAMGDDTDNLNDEYVVFENTGDTALDLSGWTVADAAGATYTVPDGTTLDPGAQVTLHTGSGEDTSTDLYWGNGRAVWNNGGDTVIVRDDEGTVVLEEAY
jgi:competence protein ComEC